MQLSHIALRLIDGPYGSLHNDFASFDTVLLVAGSTGTTFTLPILLDIAVSVKNQRLSVKRIVFLWIIKNTSWTSWTSKELTDAQATLAAAGIELSIQVHVTCNDAFTTGEDETKECGSSCDKSAGPCCCVIVDEDEDSIREVVQEKDTQPLCANKDPQSPSNLELPPHRVSNQAINPGSSLARFSKVGGQTSILCYGIYWPELRVRLVLQYVSLWG